MTTYSYRRYAPAAPYGFSRISRKIWKRVLHLELLYGAALWFVMVFLITRVYLWRIG